MYAIRGISLFRVGRVPHSTPDFQSLRLGGFRRGTALGVLILEVNNGSLLSLVSSGCAWKEFWGRTRDNSNRLIWTDQYRADSTDSSIVHVQ